MEIQCQIGFVADDFELPNYGQLNGTLRFVRFGSGLAVERMLRMCFLANHVPDEVMHVRIWANVAKQT
jgi:hypothetical protein